MTTIFAFSHLRWDFVFQRPQQLLSRLAAYYRVVFIEEPVQDPAGPFFETHSPVPGLTLCRPHLPTTAPGFHDEHLPALSQLVRTLADEHPNCVAWLYTPMALPLLQELSPAAVVYDCMDELSAFRHAPLQLAQRERALFKVADLVFTGGPSLYRAKRDRHPAVHCFPSSVDLAHFGAAADGAAALPVPEAQVGIPSPRLGFFGVIDERFDAGLIDAAATARPDWQFVMVGPTAKIDPAALPQRPNLHYPGRQEYADLPAFVAGWEVCLMPFARNEATRYISPTKVLEYMAAGKPIVSTSITDVAEPYGDIVYLADDPAAFVAACERAMSASPAERAARREAMAAVLAQTSWDRTVEEMRQLVEAVLRSNRQPAAAPRSSAGAAGQAASEGAAVATLEPVLPPAESYGCVIIGAGPTGLAAAYHLGADTLVLERNATVGGWCRSVQDRGFTFDYAGHILFSTDPYVLGLYNRLLGDNLHWQDREAWIHSHGVYTRYPYQGALYGLPPKVLKECLIGAIEARFGSLDGSAPAAEPDCCADGTDCTALGAGSPAKTSPAAGQPANFEDFIHRTWGRGVAKHFALPYNRKLWAVPLTEMETSWLGGRVPLPDLAQMIEGALEPVPRPMGPNARFGYPLRGGFAALMNAFVPHITGTLHCDANVVSISPARRMVRLADGRRFRYDTLISTMPLPELVRALGAEAPPEVRAAAAQLRHVSVRCVNLGIGRERITDKHWIYYPGDTVFHRIFVQGNASPYCNPPGGFGLTCEISYGPGKPLPCDGDELVRRCFDDCVRVGLLRPDDVLLAGNQVDLPYAYVIYDHARAANVQLIRDWLAPHDILLAGRYSEWEYYNSDHAFIAGRKAAEAVQALLATRGPAASRPARTVSNL